jgi:hypothetical protein
MIAFTLSLVCYLIVAIVDGSDREIESNFSKYEPSGGDHNDLTIKSRAYEALLFLS